MQHGSGGAACGRRCRLAAPQPALLTCLLAPTCCLAAASPHLQWELALELFQEMLREQCSPNTVTYNSLITALAQGERQTRGWAGGTGRGCVAWRRLSAWRAAVMGLPAPRPCSHTVLPGAPGPRANAGAQWQKASDVFEQMQGQGCNPDVVTYTALISALEKGGQWRLALEVSRAGCCCCCALRLAASADAHKLWVWLGCCCLCCPRLGRVCAFPRLPTHLSLPACSSWPPPLPPPPRSPSLPCQAYNRMKAQGCRADAIVYNAIIDALWETGVVWVQRRALKLFRCAAWGRGTNSVGQARGRPCRPAPRSTCLRSSPARLCPTYANKVSLQQLSVRPLPLCLLCRVAVEEGHFHQGKLVPGLARAEVSAHVHTPLPPLLGGQVGSFLHGACGGAKERNAVSHAELRDLLGDPS